MRKVAKRAVLIAMLPPAVALTFVLTLGREIGSAIRFAYLDAGSEIDSFKRYWK
jgi:hypothetical protein